MSFLGTALLVGNILNKSQSRGFSLDSLPKLANTAARPAPGGRRHGTGAPSSGGDLLHYILLRLPGAEAFLLTHTLPC